MPENRYRELLALFEKYKGVTDEITFFTSATHPPLPLEEIKRRCEILARRIPQAKALGYRAGINVLSTMGHHNENLPNSLSGDYTRVTDIDGNVSLGSFCPNDPRFQDYARELYRLVAAANPDYIWVDDDVRLAGHMPVGQTCFCDRCLAIFEQESGTKHTRASLKAGLFEGPAEPRLALRKAWLAHNRGTIERLLALIERTVHELRPGLPLGFMSGERFYEGYDFDRWARVLAGPAGAPVYWRPGGGFYEDSVDRRTGGQIARSGPAGVAVAARSLFHSVGDRELSLSPVEEGGAHHGAGGRFAHGRRLHGRGVQRVVGQRRAAGRIRALGGRDPRRAAAVRSGGKTPRTRPAGRALGGVEQGLVGGRSGDARPSTCGVGNRAAGGLRSGGRRRDAAVPAERRDHVG